jgi:hypothetical protein
MATELRCRVVSISAYNYIYIYILLHLCINITYYDTQSTGFKLFF